VAAEDRIDPALSARMRLVRRLVELGRATRAESGVKTRQPLSRALVAATGFAELSEELRAQVAEELNVSSLASLSEVGGSLVDTSAKANFRALGKRFGKGVQAVAVAVAAADAAALSASLRDHGTATVTVDGETVALTPDEVIITETPREGWSVASDSGATVALDLEITAELERAGLAREFIRLVQSERKERGFEVTDRISVSWAATQPVTGEAIREHAALIAEEVLAVEMAEGGWDDPRWADQVTAATGAPVAHDPQHGFAFGIRKH
jgi:isoleucyl-tRNA synthetase